MEARAREQHAAAAAVTRQALNNSNSGARTRGSNPASAYTGRENLERPAGLLESVVLGPRRLRQTTDGDRDLVEAVAEPREALAPAYRRDGSTPQGLYTHGVRHQVTSLPPREGMRHRATQSHVGPQTTGRPIPCEEYDDYEEDLMAPIPEYNDAPTGRPQPYPRSNTHFRPVRDSSDNALMPAIHLRPHYPVAQHVGFNNAPAAPRRAPETTQAPPLTGPPGINPTPRPGIPAPNPDLSARRNDSIDPRMYQNIRTLLDDFSQQHDSVHGPTNTAAMARARDAATAMPARNSTGATTSRLPIPRLPIPTLPNLPATGVTASTSAAETVSMFACPYHGCPSRNGGGRLPRYHRELWYEHERLTHPHSNGRLRWNDETGQPEDVGVDSGEEGMPALLDDQAGGEEQEMRDQEMSDGEISDAEPVTGASYQDEAQQIRERTRASRMRLSSSKATMRKAPTDHSGLEDDAEMAGAVQAGAGLQTGDDDAEDDQHLNVDFQDQRD